MPMDDIPYVLERSGRRRTVGITVRPDGTVAVRAPRGLSGETIDRIVAGKAGWIRKRLEMNHVREEQNRPKTFSDGEEFPFLGETYRLERVTGLKGVAIMGDRLCVGTGGRKKTESEEPAMIAARITRWYRHHAAGIITGRVEHYSAHLGLKPAAVRLKTLKSRWGSCSGRGNLNFNWLLVLAPIHIVDYVVVHELCHFVHPDHSSRFWDMVESILPDYRERRKWLRINGAALHII